MHESTGALSVAIVEDDLSPIQQLLLAEIQDEGLYGVVYRSAEDFLTTPARILLTLFCLI